MRSILAGVVLFAAVGALACSTATSEAPASVAESPKPEVPSPEVPAPDPEPLRVLVTGFNDWRELGDPPNVWRCRDNPSCRLLLGAVHDDGAQPTEFAGPLVTRLHAQAPDIEWRFATMPVTWGAFAQVPSDVDVIINIGLGVYDRFDVLQLEAGAYNLRHGADAAGVEQPGAIAAGADLVLPAPSTSPIPARLSSLAGQTVGDYAITLAEAREANSYLCNETHFHALTALGRGEGRLQAVYFLHIPYAKDGDYESLAEGVSGVVRGLVQL